MTILSTFTHNKTTVWLRGNVIGIDCFDHTVERALTRKEHSDVFCQIFFDYESDPAMAVEIIIDMLVLHGELTRVDGMWMHPDNAAEYEAEQARYERDCAEHERAYGHQSNFI